MELRLPCFRSELYCAVAQGDPANVPLWSRTVFRYSGRTIELKVIRLPEGFSAPRSALGRSFADEMDFDDTFPATVSVVSVTTRNGSGRPVRVTPPRRCRT